MNNNYKFFENIDCEYYPCHKEIDNINCLFCYCPLYHILKCGGNYTITDKATKDCKNCNKVHNENSHDFVINKLINIQFV